MENLKVGQSFEVVEVLSNTYGNSLFKVGGFTIVFNNRYALTNGSKHRGISKGIHVKGLHTATMLSKEVRPIGRLTIKSLK